MLKVTVDGVEVFVEKGSTVLQACEAVGIEIPRFCYHERLSIAGNCRMCLVEIEKTPKPVASCAMPTMNGMKIFTDTPLVKKAREAVLEFLLLNHPLDCPICDQGGECDLQDQAVAFGSDRSRFFETKRGVEDKNCGPLIKTIMTRCIHCTRCVRFATEVAGVEDLGTTGRGRETEIGTYVEKVFGSELSGNVIDLCPVGALTSKPYAFMARPWELRSTESIDISDAVGSNIRIDSRGTEILRILPRFNESVNEEWISDKARFGYDGLRYQRLDSPHIRKTVSENGQKVSRLCKTSWEEAFQKIRYELEACESPSQVGGVIGDLVDSESAFAFKDFFHHLGSSNVVSEEESSLSDNLPSSYSFNSTIAALEEADLVLLVGVNTRYEASMINTRLRKRYLEGCFTIASIGPVQDLTYPVEHLGFGTKTLSNIASGRHPFCNRLAQASKPVIICGSSVFGDSGEYNHNSNTSLNINLLSSLKDNVPNLVTESWFGLSILSKNCNDVGLRDIGLSSWSNVPNFTGNLDERIQVLYLLGADEIDPYIGTSETDSLRSSARFIIYQGHHMDRNAGSADVILPGLAFTEKRALFMNTEGRSQETNPVFKGRDLMREDWKILRALSEVIPFMKTLPYNTQDELRSKLYNTSPAFISKGSVQGFGLSENIEILPSSFVYNKRSGLGSIVVPDFYMTNAITRNSKVMAECSVTYGNRSNFLKNPKPWVMKNLKK